MSIKSPISSLRTTLTRRCAFTMPRKEAFRHLAEMPEMGHTRADLTVNPVKFWGVYSYLVVYDPASTPLTVIAVLHGTRDVCNLLKS